MKEMLFFTTKGALETFDTVGEQQSHEEKRQEF